MHTLPQNLTGESAIMLTFDDAYDSIYTQAYQYMEPHNIPGTFYIYTGAVGGANNVTPAQLLTMHNGGWAIANHTRSHTDLTTLNLAQIEAELNNGKADLQGWGITGNGPLHVSYPYGAYNATVLTAMANTGMLTGRAATTIACQQLPFAAEYEIRLAEFFAPGVTLASAKAWVDYVIANDCLGLGVFHSLVVNPNTPYHWNIADFRAFIRYLIENQVPCITIEDAYQLQSGSLTVDLPQWQTRGATRLHVMAAQED